MKTLYFSIDIKAPKEKVWNMMLEQETYKTWTSVFAKGSYYVGTWKKGEKMKFLSTDSEGMISIVDACDEYKYVSIRHIGWIKNGVEDTESVEVKIWAPSFENYTFTKRGDTTTVLVDLDTTDDFEEYMKTTWPKALEKLKEIAER